MAPRTSLGKRGYELASGPNLRDKFKQILGDMYDPDTNPNGFINLGVAENFAMLPEVADFVNRNLNLPTSAFSYGEGPWGTERMRCVLDFLSGQRITGEKLTQQRKGMARFIDKNFGVYQAVDPADILFANGVTSLCEMLGWTIGDPGDGVLLSKPIYQAFQIDFGTKANIRPVFVDFEGVDQFSPAAAVKYENALLKAEKNGTKIRMLMLCNPHNPLGQCYPKDTIIELMKVCSKYQVHLLSDEIYATSVYDIGDNKAVGFTSVLSFDHEPYIKADYCHVLYGLSKDFAAGGVRMGCIYVRNKELNRALSAITQFHWSGGPSQEIVTTILEDEAWLEGYQKTARERLAARNKLTRQLLDDAGIQYHAGANAGFFIWADLRPFLPPKDSLMGSEWDREQALVQRMFKAKFYITEGQSLTAEEPGYFRIIFSQDERTIREGFGRLLAVIGKDQAAEAV